jgi:hypothetical protein
MKKFKIHFFIFLSFCLSCSVQDKKNNKETDTSITDFRSAPVVLAEGLIIREFSIDTNLSDRKFKGIFIHCVVESDDKVHRQIAHNGFSSLFINAVIKKDGKIVHTFTNKEKAYYHSRIQFNKGNFVSVPGSHYIEMAIPFFAMQLDSGSSSLDISIQAVPAKFSDDSTIHDYRELEYLSQDIFAEKSFQYTVSAPSLEKNVLSVSNFELSKQKSRKTRFDFSLAGKGLPDLYWQISCEDEIIFTSKPVKNSLVYDETVKTPAFLYSPDDVFTISVFDYDKGPFNKKDLLGSWNGKVSELKSLKNIEFGKIKNFTFKLEKEAIKDIAKKTTAR